MDAEPQQRRGLCNRDNSNRRPAMCYFSMLIVVFFILFIVCVVALGGFGVTQYRVSNFVNEDIPEVRVNVCILFGTFNSSRTLEDGTEVVFINMTNIGSCAFALWGLISIMLVAFMWLISAFIQVFIGKVFSLLRILDFVVLFLAGILSFCLSVTITAGINTTCSVTKLPVRYCALNYLIHFRFDDDRLYYYEPVHASQNSSWVATVMLIFLTIWNFIAVIIFIKRRRKRVREIPVTKFENEDPSSSDSDPDSSELKDVVESEKPFTAT